MLTPIQTARVWSWVSGRERPDRHPIGGRLASMELPHGVASMEWSGVLGAGTPAKSMGCRGAPKAPLRVLDRRYGLAALGAQCPGGADAGGCTGARSGPLAKMCGTTTHILRSNQDRGFAYYRRRFANLGTTSAAAAANSSIHVTCQRTAIGCATSGRFAWPSMVLSRADSNSASPKPGIRPIIRGMVSPMFSLASHTNFMHHSGIVGLAR